MSPSTLHRPLVVICSCSSPDRCLPMGICSSARPNHSATWDLNSGHCITVGRSTISPTSCRRAHDPTAPFVLPQLPPQAPNHSTWDASPRHRSRLCVPLELGTAERAASAAIPQAAATSALPARIAFILRLSANCHAFIRCALVPDHIESIHADVSKRHCAARWQRSRRVKSCQSALVSSPTCLGIEQW